MGLGLRCRSGITCSQYHMVRLPGASAMSTNITITNQSVMTSTIGSPRSVASSIPTRGSARAKHRRLDARTPPGQFAHERRHLATGDPNHAGPVTRTRGIVNSETGCATLVVRRSAASNACLVLPRNPVRLRPVCFFDAVPAAGSPAGPSVLFRSQGKWMKRMFRAGEEIVWSGPTR